MALGIKIPKGAFEQGKKAYKEGSSFPDDVELTPGRHVAILKKLRGVNTANGPKMVMDFKAAGESEQAGGRFSIFYGVDADKIQYLFKDLAKLGYDVDDLDEKQLAAIAEQIEEAQHVVRVTAKQKGEYINVYLDKLLEDLTAAEVDVETTEETSEGEEESGGDEETAEGEAEEDTSEAAEEDQSGDEGGEEESEPPPAKKPVQKPAPAAKKPAAQPPAKPAAGKKPASKPAPEPEPEESEEPEPSGDEDSVELAVGDKVASTSKKWKGLAKVIHIDETGGLVKVKTDKGEVFKVKAEDIEVPA